MRKWTNGSWVVSTNKAPILGAKLTEEAEAFLGIPSPEILFGNNRLTIAQPSSGFSIEFNALDALNSVNKTGQGEDILQLAHSSQWRNSKQSQYKVHRAFDWTYTTSYQGTYSQPLPVVNTARIPYDILKKPQPILFFDEVPLYEDELGDFGLTSYSVKIRVMPDNLFVLARMYMRVDDVAFRIRDTRVYIDFVSNEIITEYVEREDSFNAVRAKIPSTHQDYTHQLRDFEWVANSLPIKSQQTHYTKLDATVELIRT